MSSIAPVSGQFSSALTFSTGAVGAAAPDAASAPGQPGAVHGALGVQTSLFMETAQCIGNVDALAALALALLLGKSSEGKNGDDPWKMLVAMAMLAGMSGGGSSVSFSQSTTVSPEAYAAPAAAASGANVNLQG
jgi:hypothetical protein